MILWIISLEFSWEMMILWIISQLKLIGGFKMVAQLTTQALTLRRAGKQPILGVATDQSDGFHGYHMLKPVDFTLNMVGFRCWNLQLWALPCYMSALYPARRTESAGAPHQKVRLLFDRKQPWFWLKNGDSSIYKSWFSVENWRFVRYKRWGLVADGSNPSGRRDRRIGWRW